MIIYRSRGIAILTNLCQMRGSVFPSAFFIAVPAAAISGLLKWSMDAGHWENLESSGFSNDSILTESAVWSGFTFLVGFLVVFRTSISYSRFWDGCNSTHRLRAEWFDACSAACAFCRHSKADTATISKFRHTLIRLFSILHALALAEIEDSSTKDLSDIAALSANVIDVRGIDEDSLLTLRDCSAKVELVFQWIQELIVENIDTGVLSIPPPILSRVFQELANGMVAFHDAVKVSSVPFPFPYAQACDTLLVLHWVMTPVITCQWVTSIAWAAFFTFTQVFILWALNLTAGEIENPFGLDPNDLDGMQMQEEMNEHLLLLLQPSTIRTPKLADESVWEEPGWEMRRGSLMGAWLSIDQGMGPCRSARGMRVSGMRISGTRVSEQSAAPNFSACKDGGRLRSPKASSRRGSRRRSSRAEKPPGDVVQVPSEPLSDVCGRPTLWSLDSVALPGDEDPRGPVLRAPLRAATQPLGEEAVGGEAPAAQEACGSWPTMPEIVLSREEPPPGAQHGDEGPPPPPRQSKPLPRA